MQRVLAAAVMAALVFGGWHFFQKYQFKGLDNVRIEPRAGAGSAGSASEAGHAVADYGGTIKIASFNIQILGRSKIAQRRVMDVLSDVIRRFDVIAIQEVRANTDDILPRFIETINSGGRKYDYLIGPRLGRSSSKEQYAFVYDTATIEVDRTAMYTVEDRADLLHREPLVGSFRVRGPPASEAFTFTLVNVHTDPDEVPQEVAALAQVYTAVRNDGRGEDDVILVGDLNADEQNFGPLGQLPNITWAISGVPTNTRGNRTYDNLLFHRAATSEFTGLTGVVDLMRDYQLTLDAALEVSDHLPVWAQFSVLEGGQVGRVAERVGTRASGVR
ncbi:MAG: endonuclease/exonuclease/phosphatase family protein [Pirellulales bacterium]